MLASIKRMKLLNKRISEILKSVLLYSLLVGGAIAATVISSDRYLFKILDRTISLQDISYQVRNLKALNCIYDDALVVKYFGRSFISDLDVFYKKFPKADEDARRYLHGHDELLKKTRYFLKMLRYSEDQKSEVSPKLAKLIKESTQENKCGSSILYKDDLRTNFVSLIEMELYLRSRYGSQLKQDQKFDTIRPSVELFVESLDKQFTHEYYW